MLLSQKFKLSEAFNQATRTDVSTSYVELCLALFVLKLDVSAASAAPRLSGLTGVATACRTQTDKKSETLKEFWKVGKIFSVLTAGSTNVPHSLSISCSCFSFSSISCCFFTISGDFIVFKWLSTSFAASSLFCRVVWYLLSRSVEQNKRD